MCAAYWRFFYGESYDFFPETGKKFWKDIEGRERRCLYRVPKDVARISKWYGSVW